MSLSLESGWLSDNRAIIGAVAALAIFPYVGPLFLGAFYTLLMIEAMVYAIFALGYDIIMGHTGMISFGHAAYFGLGVYGGALTLIHLAEGVIPMLLVGIFASTLFAIVVGFFSLRLTGVYFALITFAFAQILYEIVIRTGDITGGFNGLGVPSPRLFFTFEMSEILVYYFILITLVAVYGAVKLMMNSPLGLIFTAIGENEQRVEFLGYNVDRYKQISFILSGMISGLAGGLLLLSTGFASPNTLYWFLSGQIIVMTLFGGLGTLYGPMIGAGIIIYLEAFLSSAIGAWRIVLGIIFIVVVIYFPDGLIGTLFDFSGRDPTDQLQGTEDQDLVEERS